MITDKQAEVLKLMRDGEGMACYRWRTIHAHVGNIRVHVATYEALQSKGLINNSLSGVGLTWYCTITARGKKALAEWEKSHDRPIP